MIRLVRTTSDNPSFHGLIAELDKDLAARNGDANDFFVQHNKIDYIKNVVVAYEDSEAIGCGAMKNYVDDIVEIKRMYVRKEHRGRKISVLILNELETWASDLGYEKCILETGEQMTEALGLYRKLGYVEIPRYGPYVDVETSICFEKLIP